MQVNKIEFKDAAFKVVDLKYSVVYALFCNMKSLIYKGFNFQWDSAENQVVFQHGFCGDKWKSEYNEAASGILAV